MNDKDELVQRLSDAIQRMATGEIPGSTGQEFAGLQYAALWLAKEFRDDLTRRPTYCVCGAFVPDPSGDAGCGNCGADYGPEDRP